MKSILKWSNTIAFFAMVIVNTLANTLPIGGLTTGQVSSKSPTLFTPAPFTFSIWGVIYLMMGVFVLYQLGTTDTSTNLFNHQDKISVWFIISCIMNIAWIFSWHYQKIGFSVLFIVLLLFSLIQINLAMTVEHHTGIGKRISVYGFNIYLGWITAATIANISVFLKQLNWNRFGLSEQFWTVLIIIVGSFIGVGFVLFSHRFMSTIAVMWAYFGIFIRHMSTGTGNYDQAYPFVIIALAVAFIIMLAFIILTSVLLSEPNQSDGVIGSSMVK